MEPVIKITEWIIITVVSLLSIFLLFRRRQKFSGERNLPPGPPGWPIIGNILDLGALPHRSLTRLREKYGGVIWLRLGSINTMAIVSADAAAEFFKNHDVSFADRYVTDTMHTQGFGACSMILAPYGPYWRVMRRLVAVELMTNRRLGEAAPLRRRCVDEMVARVEEEAVKHTRGGGRGGGVNVACMVGLTLVNLIGILAVSRDMLGSKSEVGPRFMEAVDKMIELSEHANVADLFPWLRRFDPQGTKRKVEVYMGKALELPSTFLKDRRKEMSEIVEDRMKKRKDFLDVMLEFEGSGEEGIASFSDDQIRVVILELFMATTDTTSGSVEWAMAELLRDREVMNKTKAELNRVVGRNRKVEESDIDNLPYLRAVVKESMRLHPQLPLLVPRKAVHDTKFMTYDVPKGTQVYVNVWAISRDPKVWDDPLSFRPERFLGSNVDYKGLHHEFIPFGAGRRICAGVALAHRLLHLILGTLLHEFDWEVDGTLDMEERFGFTMKKTIPLVVVPKKCV